MDSMVRSGISRFSRSCCPICCYALLSSRFIEKDMYFEDTMITKVPPVPFLISAGFQISILQLDLW